MSEFEQTSAEAERASTGFVTADMSPAEAAALGHAAVAATGPEQTAPEQAAPEETGSGHAAVGSAGLEQAAPETPVAAALRDLETLGERDLAEHPDVYQRIHAELQSALATIDNA